MAIEVSNRGNLEDRGGHDRRDSLPDRAGVPFTFGMQSAREYDDECFSPRVNPQRSTRESSMPKRPDRKKIASATAEGTSDIKTNSAQRGHSDRRLWYGHGEDAKRGQDPHAFVSALAEQHLSKDSQVIYCREKSGMSRRSAHAKGGRIVHRASQHEALPRFGGSDPSDQAEVRLKPRVFHSKGTEDPLTGEFTQRWPLTL